MTERRSFFKQLLAGCAALPVLAKVCVESPSPRLDKRIRAPHDSEYISDTAGITEAQFNAILEEIWRNPATRQ